MSAGASIFTYQLRAILLAVLMCALLFGFQLLWLNAEKLPKDPDQSSYQTSQSSSLLLVEVTPNFIYVNGEEIETLEEVKSMVLTFVDNNGSGNCSYCEGESTSHGSAHPKEAKIQLVVRPGVHYGRFASVQNEVNAAYRTLREGYAKKYFRKPFDKLTGKEQLIVTRSYPKAVQFEHVEPEWVIASD